MHIRYHVRTQRRTCIVDWRVWRSSFSRAQHVIGGFDVQHKSEIPSLKSLRMRRVVYVNSLI